MQSKNRGLQIFGTVVIVLLVAGLRAWYRADHSWATGVVVVVIALIILGMSKLINHVSGSEVVTPPQPQTSMSQSPTSQPAAFVFNHKNRAYTNLESMPPDVLREYLAFEKFFAKAFPESFSEKLVFLGRGDLATEFEGSFNLYKASRLTRDELNSKIHQLLAKIEADTSYNPAKAVKKTALLIHFTYNGVTYSNKETLPRHLSTFYQQELANVFKNNPDKFEDLLENHGYTDVASELKEARRMHGLNLITEADYEVTLQQILERLA